MSSVDAFINEDEEETVWLQFETKYVVQDPDLHLAVSGSVPELGSWDIRHAALAVERPENSGQWSATVFLPFSTPIEWKWVVLRGEEPQEYRWEERNNRWCNTGYRCGRIVAPWNRDYSFHPAPEEEGVQWNLEDKVQLDELICCMEKHIVEHGGSTNSLPVQTQGKFCELVEWLRIRFLGWYRLLQNSFRNLMNSLSTQTSNYQ